MVSTIFVLLLALVWSPPTPKNEYVAFQLLRCPLSSPDDTKLEIEVDGTIQPM